MQRPDAVLISLRGRTLTRFLTVPYNLQVANWSDIISQTGHCKTKTADCDSRLSVKRLQSSFCILHPACVLLSVCSLHFTSALHSAFYTDRLSNSPRKQLDTHEPSVLNIYMEKHEIPVG